MSLLVMKNEGRGWKRDRKTEAAEKKRDIAERKDQFPKAGKKMSEPSEAKKVRKNMAKKMRTKEWAKYHKANPSFSKGQLKEIHRQIMEDGD